MSLNQKPNDESEVLNWWEYLHLYNSKKQVSSSSVKSVFSSTFNSGNDFSQSHFEEKNKKPLVVESQNQYFHSQLNSQLEAQIPKFQSKELQELRELQELQEGQVESHLPVSEIKFKHENQSYLQGPCINNRFYLGKPIAEGAFGQVFVAKDIESDSNQEVAIKLEERSAKYPQLEFEAKVYRWLSGGKGIPNLTWYGQEGAYNVLVVERLGYSLQHLFEFCKGRFSLKTVLSMTIMILDRLEYMHTRGVIHRDLKPENFVLGLGENSSVLYVIDFGLSKCFRDPVTQKHIPFKKGKSLTGTPRYASINNHRGYEQSRRDDLESLIYIVIYLLKGNLPWQKLKYKKGEDKMKHFKQIERVKESVSSKQLCKGLPSEFSIMLDYARALNFDETPEYERLRCLLRNLFKKKGFLNDNYYDWTERMVKQMDM